MRRKPVRFVVCVSDRGDRLSVQRGKLYRLVEPEGNDPRSMLRVIDETGEDYLYPRDWFIAVTIRAARDAHVRKAVLAALEAA